MAVAIKLLTLGVLAQRNKSPAHRIRYIIESRDIQPVGRAGMAYVYSEAAADQIASELRRIEGDREVGA